LDLAAKKAGLQQTSKHRIHNKQ